MVYYEWIARYRLGSRVAPVPMARDGAPQQRVLGMETQWDSNGWHRAS